MIQPAHLGRIGKQIGRFINDERIILPTVPMTQHNLDKFIGPIVAEIMIDGTFAAHILRFSIIQRGHNIPGDTAMGHQIKGRKHTRYVERLIICGRHSGAQTKLVGRHGHRHQGGNRI